MVERWGLHILIHFGLPLWAFVKLWTTRPLGRPVSWSDQILRAFLALCVLLGVWAPMSVSALQLHHNGTEKVPGEIYAFAVGTMGSMIALGNAWGYVWITALLARRFLFPAGDDRNGKAVRAGFIAVALFLPLLSWSTCMSAVVSPGRSTAALGPLFIAFGQTIWSPLVFGIVWLIRWALFGLPVPPVDDKPCS